MKSDQALLIVDVQNDFCPGGALAVPEGDKVVPVLNEYVDYFVRRHWPVLASRDWHPAKAGHFQPFGGSWPVHCVQETPGARFHPRLKLPKETVVLSKGTAEDQDGYSAFEGQTAEGETLTEILADFEVKELYVGGLATDYCVKASCLDALKNGLTVFLLQDAVKGVNIKADDARKSVEEMRKAGAKTMTLTDLKKR